MNAPTPREHDFRRQTDSGRWGSSVLCRHCGTTIGKRRVPCVPVPSTPVESVGQNAIDPDHSSVIHEVEQRSGKWAWGSILPLAFLLFMLTGLCGHTHKNIMGTTLCEHSHIYSPSEVIRSITADAGVGHGLRHIGNHCNRSGVLP